MKNNKGFTLLETLVGLLILAIGLLGTAELMTTTIRNNAFRNHRAEAFTLAEDKMEKIRSNTDEPDPSPIVRTGVAFTRAKEVVVQDEGWSAGMKIITVTVKWKDITNHSIKLSTVMN